MKKYSLSVLFFALCMLVTAAGAAMIVAPNGVLAPGSTGTFPVAVGGLDGAEGVTFNLTFDNTLLSVENVSGNNAFPGSQVDENIDNEHGWVSVAVTNPEGITAGDIWPLPPLVDITFRATEKWGESAMRFAETPTYSQGFDPVDFDWAYDYDVLAVRDPSTIQAPSGTLASGQPQTLSVGVDNLTGATEIWFELVYDGSYLIIDDIQSALPGAVIVDAFADNGICEVEHCALESVPEEVRLNLQQHPHMNMMWGTLEIPGGLTTGYTDIVDVTFRPTNLAGTSDISPYGSWYVGEDWHSFDVMAPGQIVTNGGGSYPGLGEFKAPSGTIDVGSQKVLPIMVRSLGNAEEVYIWAEWNSDVINATSLSLSADAEAAGVTLDWGGINHYSYANVSVGDLTAYVGNLTRLNTKSWIPLLDLTVKANAVSGRTPVNISACEVCTTPRENVTIMFQPASLENGLISITVPDKADLIGILVDPPQYVKKYTDGSLRFNQTMIIENIGSKAVTKDFQVEAKFGSSKESFTVVDDIAPGANITYHMTMNVVPDYGDTRVDIRDQGYEKFYTVSTAGDIEEGSYRIGLNIDVDNVIDEIDKTNNHKEILVEITRPDLIPIWEMEFVHGPPSSNTTILDTSVAPGIWKVTFGVKNIGNVYAIPTTLNYSMTGKIPQIHSVQQLGPNENWTETATIDVGRAITEYFIEVNADRTEAETNYANNIEDNRIGSVAPVTVILPKTSAAAKDYDEKTVWITNITSTAPVTAFQIPVIYDPTVCNVTVVSKIQGVDVKPAYGRLTLDASNLTSPLINDTCIATIKLYSLTDSGRTSVLDSSKSAYVKTDGGAFLELEIVRGEFKQTDETDAKVTVFASPQGAAGQNQTISVTIQNQRLNSVTVSADLSANDDRIWTMQNISLAGRASKTFTINTWKPTGGGIYLLNATITGDDIPTGNSASRNIFIEDYLLKITDQNKLYWDSWYSYNKSVLKGEYFTLGTYFTANQSGMVNATLAITYPNGVPVNLTDTSVFELYNYYYPAQQDVYGYDSEWNSVSWYYIVPKQLGDFKYNITLEARDKNAYTTGTIRVREPNVDIKVMNTILVTDEDVTMTFPVFNRTPSEGRNVQLLLSAGADGRTLQGLESLIGYPHGCPEQVMSPALAALRVKQYYGQRGALNDDINQTVQTTMRNALGHMNETGYNAQQASGGWAWGTYSSPSLFYTLYPNYVITELLRDDDLEFWDLGPSMNGIDLNKSANWLINRQNLQGHWSDWGYISNDAEWTGFMSENLVNEYPYLNDAMKEAVNASLEKSCGWLLKYEPDAQQPQTISYAIFGLIAIRDHGIGDAETIDGKISDLKEQLWKKSTGSGADFYWSDEYGWDTYEPTASAIVALNRADMHADELSGAISYLIGNRAGRSYSGGWGSTRASAAVINALTNVVLETPDPFTVDVQIMGPSGDLIWSDTNIDLQATSFRSNYPPLSTNELDALYGFGSLNGTATVIISNKSDANSPNPAKLSVSIDSFEQVPESIAKATIPAKYIDPIATDFDLQIAAPAPGALKEGESGVVRFTINNNLEEPRDQSMMIIEIPISNAVNFTGSATGADTAYYGDDNYISHMYDATEKKLYIYPGSDDESKPSVKASESKTFCVPLEFGVSGNVTVEARAYPMYNDTWMALGTGSTYVLGYGNVTLAAVDESNKPVDAEFYIGGDSVAPKAKAYNGRLLEGVYPVAIKKDSIWINSTVNVVPSESVTYTAHFASDRSVPYIAQAEGTAGEIQIMPPEIEDTISDISPNHWNAAIPAMKSFNATIASSGGRATLAVDIPKVSRTAVNDTGTYEYSVYLNDKPVNVSMYDGENWSSYEYYPQSERLTISDIDTSKIKQISITFTGREYGNVDNDEVIDVADAFMIVKARYNQVSFTENQWFYADVDNDGIVDVADAFLLVKWRFDQVDHNYQPK